MIVKNKAEKLPSKWMEDITVLKSKCKDCEKFYMTEKMLNQGFRIIFGDGSTTIGSNEYFYYCNEACLDNWKSKNTYRVLSQHE